MEPRKISKRASDKSDKPRSRHRVLKTAGVLAAIGAAAYGIAKARKTARGRALEKKVRTKGRKVLRKAKSVTRTSAGRRARRTTSR
jgi:hypothetical protein